jgi:hypothetical protein
MTVTVHIYMYLIARQLFKVNSYIEFRENPTNYLVADTRLRIDRRKDVVPTCTLFILRKESLKNSQLMLYKNKITICSEIHTKHVNVL